MNFSKMSYAINLKSKGLENSINSLFFVMNNKITGERFCNTLDLTYQSKIQSTLCIGRLIVLSMRNKIRKACSYTGTEVEDLDLLMLKVSQVEDSLNLFISDMKSNKSGGLLNEEVVRVFNTHISNASAISKIR